MEWITAWEINLKSYLILPFVGMDLWNLESSATAAFCIAATIHAAMRPLACCFQTPAVPPDNAVIFRSDFFLHCVIFICKKIFCNWDIDAVDPLQYYILFLSQSVYPHVWSTDIIFKTYLSMSKEVLVWNFSQKLKLVRTNNFLKPFLLDSWPSFRNVSKFVSPRKLH